MCKFNVVLTIAVVLFAASAAQAELLLSDNFTGMDGAGINDGLVARQGGSLGTVSYQSYDDTSCGVPIAIQGNMLEFGGRPDQFAPDHDFVDSAITSAGGFVVEFDTNPIVEPAWNGDYLSSFDMGRTAAKAADGHCLAWGDLQDTTTDWSIQICGNGNYLTAGHGSSSLSSGVFDPDPAGDPTYHVKIQVDTNSFASGEAFSVSVWIDGNLLPTFPYNSTWDTDGANYMGIWTGIATSSDKSTVDNLSISTIPEPSTVALLMTGLIGLLAYAWRKRK